MTELAGTGALVRLILRRDRVRLAVWIGALGLVAVATASALAKLLPMVESRALFAAGITGNPALVSLIGPVFDPTTIGGLVAWRLGGIGAVATGLLSLLTVVRHTRAEEEAGRRELVGSAAIGRHAPLAAALLVTGGADVLIAVVVAAGLLACDLPIAGAIALGLSFAFTGWIFAGLAAIAAQLVENARAAGAIAGALLGASYVARAIGDASHDRLSWLSWASPIGWAQRVRPFAGEQWWLCAVATAIAAILAGIAQALSVRRDLGAGLLPPRHGPATASPRLAGPLALAWRMQRGALLGWTAGFLTVGAALGGVAQSVAELLNTSPRMRVLIITLGGDGGIVDAYFTAIFGILGMVAAGYALQATLRLRSEEEDARAEPILAAAVGRLRWAASHLVFAVLGPAIALAIAGAAAGVVHGGVDDVPRLLVAALIQLPAIWVVVGIAVVLFGLAPRIARASWGVLAACILVDQLGRLLQLPTWCIDLSPFSHLPQLPGGAVHAAALLQLLAVAAAFVAVGLLSFRRRDLG
jgi:polyether ionophore transport system permease protein